MTFQFGAIQDQEELRSSEICDRDDEDWRHSHRLTNSGFIDSLSIGRQSTGTSLPLPLPQLAAAGLSGSGSMAVLVYSMERTRVPFLELR